MRVRRIVLPGEYLAHREGRKIGQGVYLEGEQVFAKILGIPRIEKDEIYVIPTGGVYVPQTGDKIIGVISSTEISGWFVDINCPWLAFMPLAEAVEEFVDRERVDLSRFYDLGDIIYCRISKVTRNKDVRVSMRDIEAKKLYGGVLVKVSPAKIPRIVGRRGSMINLIKARTGCKVLIGENGVIWIKGREKAKAVQAIRMIEKEALLYGLTAKIERMLGGKEGREVSREGKED
jgi:exosome complex component RRP4